MLLTPHTLVGASIGASIQNIPLIIVLGISSHFVLDAIPHFDWGIWHNYEKNFQLETKDYILLICDIMLATVLFYWVWNANNFDYLMLLGAFCAVLPDLIDNVPFWKHRARKTWFGGQLHTLHIKVHFLIKPKYWYWGVVTQIIIIIACIYYLLD
ncbi:MAG: hypothetical protein ACTSRA_20500 [Promethearchaeota archaeon]